MKTSAVTRRGAHEGAVDPTADRAHPWQFALVVTAAMAPVAPGLAFSRYTEGFAYPVTFSVTAALVALPLFLHRRRAGFVRAAATVGAVMVPWSLLGSLGGLGVFFLSVPLLWAAAAADPRRRPAAAAVLAAGGVLLAVAMVAVPGFWWRR
ncbi:hypothetical protein ACFWUZ_12590 [Streptomyces sp. NPDC058646]|uniref:hypothetical protein n=1 Tax=Streptomyces sp. NPDC058646 TaxID=3346574 RepID=UPI00365DA9D5